MSACCNTLFNPPLDTNPQILIWPIIYLEKREQTMGRKNKQEEDDMV